MHQPGERTTDPTKSIERRKKKLSYWRVKIIQKSWKKKYEMSAVWKLFLVIWILYSSKTNEAFRPASATFVPWFFFSSFFLSSAIHFLHNRHAVAALCAFLIPLQHPPQITFQTCLNCFFSLFSCACYICCERVHTLLIQSSFGKPSTTYWHYVELLIWYNFILTTMMCLTCICISCEMFSGFFFG